MANVQHLEVCAGENRTLTIAGRDASNAVATLTGKTVSVYVGRRPSDPDSTTAVLTKGGTVVSASAGTFSIAITPTDTESMDGDYQYQARTVSSDGGIAVVALGRFRVLPGITS